LRFVRDPLGCPLAAADGATGAIAQRMGYEAWGNVLVDTNPDFQPSGFVGNNGPQDTCGGDSGGSFGARIEKCS